MAAGILGIALGALPSVADTVKVLVDRFVPDPAEKERARVELERIISAREQAMADAAAKQAEAQAGINLAEATGNDKFSSRWRPAVGWICVAGLGYQFLLSPLLGWIIGIVSTLTGLGFPPPPTVSTVDLMYLLGGILGLGVMRTYERTTGVPGALPPTR